MVILVTIIASAIVVGIILFFENKKAAKLARERQERYENALEYFNKQGFKCSRSYGDMFIDEKSEKFAIIGYLQPLSYSSLLKYEIRQGEQIIRTSGNINGISGGTKIGGLGISTSTSRVNTVSVSSHLPPTVVIYTKSNKYPKIDIKCSSENEADRYGSLLEFIISENKKPIPKPKPIQEPKPAPVPTPVPTPVPAPAPVQKLSNADELIKLKSLLDAGVLTQEEFNSEKAKILSK